MAFRDLLFIERVISQRGTEISIYYGFAIEKLQKGSHAQRKQIHADIRRSYYDTLLA